ncbi:hypothetical protein P691DRAFT_782459 [Macrolepiota fuliginosa MF-IS2]|uniref:Uncharacterized protein n=1 Tax=Macrolepiota fuliginosa MF-IS2 TaxID=1400762 RepID=A0A9P5XAG2_9AGAR|nr:hypothetical protein P691DRAFT_782459 [Macrolepiota fuliginosa MF-IS2]
MGNCCPGSAPSASGPEPPLLLITLPCQNIVLLAMEPIGAEIFSVHYVYHIFWGTHHPWTDTKTSSSMLNSSNNVAESIQFSEIILSSIKKQVFLIIPPQLDGVKITEETTIWENYWDTSGTLHEWESLSKAGAQQFFFEVMDSSTLEMVQKIITRNDLSKYMYTSVLTIINEVNSCVMSLLAATFGAKHTHNKDIYELQLWECGPWGVGLSSAQVPWAVKSRRNMVDHP